MSEALKQQLAPAATDTQDPLGIMSNHNKAVEDAKNLANAELAKMDIALEKRLMGMSLKEVMRELKIPNSNNSRHHLVERLELNGKITFNGEFRRAYDKKYNLDNNRHRKGGAYLGTARQNNELKRQIIKNRHLFENGKLTNVNARKWEI